MEDLDMEDLDNVLRQLENSRRSGLGSENLFVLVLERTPQGGTRLISYGLKSISELAAYIAVNRTNPTPTERNFA